MSLFGLIYLASILFITNAANVLIIPSSLYPVHRYTMRYLAEELIRRNHTVTWFEYGLKKSDISLPSGIKEQFVKIDAKNNELFDLYVHRNHSVYNRLWTDESYWYESETTTAWFASIELCSALLNTPNLRDKFDQLVAKKFDAVVVDDQFNPCGLLLIGLQKSIFVYWSLTGLRTESAWANHSPSPPSFVPVPGTGLTDELNVFERIYNLASYLRQLYIHQHIVLRRIDALFQKHYPNSNLPEAFYLERNASINFVNHPPIFDFARAYMPRVNFVGGLHCKKPKQLNSKLFNFVLKSNDEFGFILISNGFSDQWKHAPKKMIENVIEMVNKLKEIRFVWQYNGLKKHLPKELPENIYIDSWLPQQDLLGHSKCRAHISHGGLNSVIESVWHGVPIVGWPLTAHHYDNLLRVTARNAGIMLEIKQPNALDLISAVNRIYIRHYKEEILIFQDMVIDVPYTELNHSAFWVEFIIRHQEVPHARSGADELNIFQYFLIDVIGVVVIGIVAIVYSLIFVLRLLLRAITYPCTRNKKTKKLDEIQNLNNNSKKKKKINKTD